MGLQNVMVGPYDYQLFISDHQLQPILLGEPVRNTAGMNLQIKPSGFPCSIRVEDQK